MLEAIEKLLILQDRDRKIRRVQQELGHIGPERETLRAKAATTQTQLDAAKNRVKQIESERKRLELDVEAKKTQIEKYANQQLQTRKNEEYRALAHEIDLCKADIVKIEDQEIVLMEQGEAAQKEVTRATQEANEAKKLMDEPGRATGPARGKFEEGTRRIAGRTARNWRPRWTKSARTRYERLLKSKGDNVIVGVDNGVCGGCHMKLPPQVLVTCRSQQEIVACSNCGRILYYTRDMALAAAE